LAEFVDFVEAVGGRSNGIVYGVNMKMPKREDQQFKVILRILEKMFKKEINEERVKSIISKIDRQLKARGNAIIFLNSFTKSWRFGPRKSLLSSKIDVPKNVSSCSRDIGSPFYPIIWIHFLSLL
jgi:hypothetical protein